MNATTGPANLSPDGWMPMSAMTEEDRQAMAERLDAEHVADNLASAAARKIVSIADRMPAR